MMIISLFVALHPQWHWHDYVVHTKIKNRKVIAVLKAYPSKYLILGTLESILGTPPAKKSCL